MIYSIELEGRNSYEDDDDSVFTVCTGVYHL